MLSSRPPDKGCVLARAASAARRGLATSLPPRAALCLASVRSHTKKMATINISALARTISAAVYSFYFYINFGSDSFLPLFASYATLVLNWRPNTLTRVDWVGWLVFPIRHLLGLTA